MNTYDTLNRLSTAVDSRLGTTSYSYDSASNLATATYPNAIETTFTYDTLNRVTDLESQLGNYAYELGPTGNRTSVSEPSGRSVTWSYDGIYRLTNEAITGAPSGKNGTVTRSATGSRRPRLCPASHREASRSMPMMKLRAKRTTATAIRPQPAARRTPTTQRIIWCR